MPENEQLTEERLDALESENRLLWQAYTKLAVRLDEATQVEEIIRRARSGAAAQK